MAMPTCSSLSTSTTKSNSNLKPLPPTNSVLTTKKVLRAAEALQIPVYVTTQNRARLGDTVSDLAPFLAPAAPTSGDSGSSSSNNPSGPLCRAYADKTIFSMWIPALTSQLPAPPAPSSSSSSSSPPSPPANIVLVGIESHICITQTALDAQRAGHRVYVLADGVSSCNKEEVPIALARLRAEGVTVTTSESWLYETVGDAGLPEFKSVIGIVKDTMQDTKAALAALAPVQGGSKI